MGRPQQRLIRLELDSQVFPWPEQSPQVSGEAVRFAEIGIVSAYAKRGIDRSQCCLPSLAKRSFGPSGGIVEQPEIGVSGKPAELGRKAVDADVHHPMTAANPTFYPRLDAHAIREVILIQQRFTLGLAEVLRELGKQARVANGSIQVDQQSCHRAEVQRSTE